MSKILIIISNGSGKDIELDSEPLGIDFQSNDNDILKSVEAVLVEQNLTMKDSDDFIFVVRRAVHLNKIYLFPKPIMG